MPEYEAKLREAKVPQDEDEIRRLVRRERIYLAHNEQIAARHKWPISAVHEINELSLGRTRQECLAPPDVVPTPFRALNAMMLDTGAGEGLSHGWSGLIAGRSNIGKTSLALWFAVHAARHGERVLYLPLEGNASNVHTRLLAMTSGLGMALLAPGKLFDEAKRREAEAEYLTLPGRIFMAEEAIYELVDLKGTIEFFHKAFECRTFILDHMQLASTGSDRSIYDRVTEISHVCRTLARKLKILSLCTSQLNRRAALETSQCPTMFDLLGGTPLEADSDFVFLLDHCKKHYEWNKTLRALDTYLIVSKNRYGPKDNIRLRLNFSTQQWEER